MNLNLNRSSHETWREMHAPIQKNVDAGALSLLFGTYNGTQKQAHLKTFWRDR